MKKNVNMYMHLSFDDVEMCINNIKNNFYNSIFEEPFLSELKILHDQYHAVFSLYCYTEIFKDMPICYQQELIEQCNWLKFGIHAPNKQTDYSKYTFENARKEYDDFVQEVYNFTGSYDAVERFPRLHCFAASKEAIKAMSEAEWGIKGLLTAEKKNPQRSLKNRRSYQLSFNKPIIYDEDTLLYYVQTSIRCDWLVSIKKWIRVYPFCFGKVDCLLNCLQKKGSGVLEIFAHEWNTEAMNEIIKCCLWGNYHGIEFAFHQNKISILKTIAKDRNNRS